MICFTLYLNFFSIYRYNLWQLFEFGQIGRRNSNVGFARPVLLMSLTARSPRVPDLLGPTGLGDRRAPRLLGSDTETCGRVLLFGWGSELVEERRRVAALSSVMFL